MALAQEHAPPQHSAMDGSRGKCRYLDGGRRCHAGCVAGRYVCHHWNDHGDCRFGWACRNMRSERPDDSSRTPRRSRTPRHPRRQEDGSGSGGVGRDVRDNGSGGADSRPRVKAAPSALRGSRPPSSSERSTASSSSRAAPRVQKALSLLGLSPTGEFATKKMVESCFRLRSLAAHPDKAGLEASAEEKQRCDQLMRELTEAKDLLLEHYS